MTVASMGSGSAERHLYRVSSGWRHDEYGAYRADDLERVKLLADADLVSSQTRPGTHRPLFDVDHPAAAVGNPDGSVTVWFDLRSTRRSWQRLVDVAAGSGIAAHLPVDSRHTRRERFTAERERCFNTGEALSWLLNNRNDNVPFSVRLEQARTVGVSLPVFAPQFADPWPLVLTAPMLLLPSTHNAHLYVEAEMTWRCYQQLLVAARKARLLERRWVRAAKFRRETHLRLPWSEKPEM